MVNHKQTQQQMYTQTADDSIIITKTVIIALATATTIYMHRRMSFIRHSPIIMPLFVNISDLMLISGGSREVGRRGLIP